MFRCLMFISVVNTGTNRVHFVKFKYKNIIMNEEIAAFYFKHYTNKHQI